METDTLWAKQSQKRLEAPRNNVCFRRSRCCCCCQYCHLRYIRFVSLHSLQPLESTCSVAPSTKRWNTLAFALVCFALLWFQCGGGISHRHCKTEVAPRLTSEKVWLRVWVCPPEPLIRKSPVISRDCVFAVLCYWRDWLNHLSTCFIWVNQWDSLPTGLSLVIALKQIYDSHPRLIFIYLPNR